MHHPQHDLEQLLDQLERQPVFGGISPREVYELGGFGEETPKELSDRDAPAIVEQAIGRL